MHLTYAIEHWGDLPDIQMPYHYRGVAYEILGEYDKSIADLTKAIELHPNVYSHYSRGKAYGRKKNYHLALADYLSAVHISPDDYRSLNAAAWLLSCSPIDSDRDGKRAVELAKKALEEIPYFDWICLDTLACAYAETGDFKNGVKYMLEAKKVYVDDFEAGLGPEPKEYAEELEKFQNKVDLFESGKPFREKSKEE